MSTVLFPETPLHVHTSKAVTVYIKTDGKPEKPQHCSHIVYYSFSNTVSFPLPSPLLCPLPH